MVRHRRVCSLSLCLFGILLLFQYCGIDKSLFIIVYPLKFININPRAKEQLPLLFNIMTVIETTLNNVFLIINIRLLIRNFKQSFQTYCILDKDI